MTFKGLNEKEKEIFGFLLFFYLNEIVMWDFNFLMRKRKFFFFLFHLNEVEMWIYVEEKETSFDLKEEEIWDFKFVMWRRQRKKCFLIRRK